MIIYMAFHQVYNPALRKDVEAHLSDSYIRGQTIYRNYEALHQYLTKHHKAAYLNIKAFEIRRTS